MGGRVIIGLKDPAASEGVDNQGRVLASPTGVRAAKEALRTLGVTPIFEFRRTPTIVANVSPEVAVALRRNARVDYIEPAMRGQLESQVTPWNLIKVNAPQAWSFSTGSGVKLLVMDSGVDSVARDLYTPLAWRCISDGGPVWDHVGHGTFVAGVAGALNNSVDVIGAAYGVTLYSANIVVLGTPPSPDAAQAACSVDVARVNGVDVVNMSFSFPGPSTALTDQINGGYNEDDMIFVAAVGNQGGAVTYPATLANVIAVTAVDSTNAHPGFANTGSAVDLSAPGVAVLSTSLPSGSQCSSGGCTATCDSTSFATPHVSAGAAVLRARYPTWSNTAIRNRLQSTATDLGAAGFDNTFGHGLLNIASAIGMTVAVAGPSIAYLGYSSTWSALVSGGQTPYSYQWFINGVPSGTGSSINYTPGGSNFWLKLHATDLYGTLAKDSLYVTVSSCTPPEIIC